MPDLRRPRQRDPSRFAVRLVLAAAAFWAAAGGAFAREVTIGGTRMRGYGRILLQFDQPTKVQVTAANSVVVITFAAPAKIKSEKLATDLGPYVSATRRDPDETGIRIALAGSFRTNVLEAGERVYIDLLPAGWKGILPGLPPEVVAELAERVRVAEEKVASEAKRKPEPKPVGLRLAILPTLTRVVFEPPPGAVPTIKSAGEEVELAFEGAAGLNDGGERPRLAPGIASFEVEQAGTASLIKVAAAPGFTPHVFREGDSVVLDLAKPAAKPAPPRPEPAPAAAPKSPKPEMAEAPAPPKAPAPPVVALPPAPVAAPPAPVASAPVPPDRPRPADAKALPPGTVVPRFEADGSGGVALVLPFATRPPAAAFERGGALTLVVETPDRLDESALVGDAARLLPPGGVTLRDDLLVLRFPTQPEGPGRLLADGSNWRVAFGGRATLPPDVLKLWRGTDENGRSLVAVTLPSASGVHWLKDPDGTRLAVVPASGRVQGLPSPRSFVEFTLPATLHGLVVEARADDVSVGLGQQGVTIARDGGLSLTPLTRLREGGAGSGFLVTRESWGQDTSGSFMERYHDLVAEAANAPSSGRAEARWRLARFLLANDLATEAAGVLALARGDDAVFARRREALILSGIASVKAGRFADGRLTLSGETIAEDPEAVLWRAAADAGERRWPQALVGLRRSGELMESYPDDVAGPLRLATLSAALAVGDTGKAEAELAAIDRLIPGSVPRDDHDLARARVDEASGRTDSALKGYAKLAENWLGPAGASAILKGTILGLRTGTIDAPAAIAKLELLSVAWRGGEIEIATIAELARLYGQAGRWRDMFTLTRQASRFFPDHDLTRALQDDTARRIESLLLGPESEALSPVETLALYFDFKELTPVGRRADEIVRRLADRLVELDLLDKAADLLQYQVDKRLTGVARATVGARLATVRLMAGKPLLALQTLRATRLAELPEEVRRFRFMLEARAQSDLSRADLALEVLEGETGPDFARLRVGILWTAKRWREAGEASEALAGRSWEGTAPLTDRDRKDVIRAAIADVLADERIALDRLRTKFGAKMRDSPDAPKFDLLQRPGAASTPEFRTLVREASRADILKQLLEDWRIAEPETGAPTPPQPAGTAGRS